MPRRFSVTLSDDLYAAAEALAKRRNYRSLSEYMNGLIRYDGQTQREHRITVDWASFSGAERDRLDAAIRSKVEAEEGVNGSWFEALVRDVIAERESNGKPLEIKGIAKDVARKPTKTKPI